MSKRRDTNILWENLFLVCLCFKLEEVTIRERHLFPRPDTERQSTHADKVTTTGFDLAGITRTKKFLFLSDLHLLIRSFPVVHSPVPSTVIRFIYKPLLHQPALKHSDISFTSSINFHYLLIRLYLQDANYESTHYLIMLIYTTVNRFPILSICTQNKPSGFFPFCALSPQSILQWFSLPFLILCLRRIYDFILIAFWHVPLIAMSKAP